MAASSSVRTAHRIRGVPPLVNGDHLTREEFERRYEAMPRVKKAELIEGVVYMPSPVNQQKHGKPNADIVGWLVSYQAATPGVQVGTNSTIRLDQDSEPQPDALLMIDPSRGGQARFDEDGYIEGAPELVVEVVASSANFDLHEKLRAYCRNGAKEYVAWRTFDEAIDWFVLRGGAYERIEPDASGLCRSQTFPGLWLDVPALLKGDMATVLQKLGEGLASPGHAEFVAKLQKSSPRS